MKEGIRVKSLTIGYREPLLRDLSFQMAEGEFWIVVGPNGVGKSTLLKTMVGINPPLSGKIFIHGVDCTNGCDEKRFVSYVPQMENYSHNFPATALDIVLSGFFPRLGRFQKLTDTERRVALQWMELLEVESIAHERFNNLSGGQQRKTLIARALVSNPHYIFLDEPTIGVDLKSSRRILKAIYRLNRESKFGILMVTHDINFVWEYAEKVILIGYNEYFIGNKDEILNEELLSEIYEVDVKIAETEYGPVFLVGDKHV